MSAAAFCASRKTTDIIPDFAFNFGKISLPLNFTTQKSRFQDTRASPHF
jgi:hypothetical protein